jgi:Na+-driven multidrug efflux pump
MSLMSPPNHDRQAGVVLSGEFVSSREVYWVFFPDQVYVAGIVQASLFIVLYVLFRFLYIVLFDCFLSSDQYHHCVIIRFARRFVSSLYLHKM